MTFLFRDRLSAVFSQEIRLAHKKIIRLKDLVDLPLILMDPETSNRKLLDRAFESIGCFVKPRYEVTRMTTAIAMAEAGLGVAVLPSSLFKTKRDHRLRVQPIQHAMLVREIGIIQQFGRPLSPEAEKFLIFLKSIRKTLRLDPKRKTTAGR